MPFFIPTLTLWLKNKANQCAEFFFLNEAQAKPIPRGSLRFSAKYIRSRVKNPAKYIQAKIPKWNSSKSTTSECRLSIPIQLTIDEERDKTRDDN